MRIDKYLDKMYEHYLLMLKDDSRKAEEIKQIAWKCVTEGYISAFHYSQFCKANNKPLIF